MSVTLRKVSRGYGGQIAAPVLYFAAMKKLLLALTVAAALAPPANAACPAWIEGGSTLVPGGPGDDECWVPVVTYRHNLATLEGEAAVYVTRSAMLANQGQMFSTRQELETYIESGAIRGLWDGDPVICGGTPKCRWVPASAFDRIDLRQIVDRR